MKSWRCYFRKPKLTLFKYEADPKKLELYLSNFTEGSQFQMTMSFLSYRGEVREYHIDHETSKITVKFHWLCSRDNSIGSNWTDVPLQDLELCFVKFYLQIEGHVKIWTRRKQVVGHFYRNGDPTNIKRGSNGSSPTS